MKAIRQMQWLGLGSTLLLATAPLAAQTAGWKRVQAPESPPVTALSNPTLGQPMFVSLQTPSLYYLGGAGLLSGGGTAFSSDGGASWQREFSLRNPVLSHVVHHPTDANILFGANVGIWKSTDGGHSWSPKPGPFNAIERIAVSHANPDRVYGVGYIFAPGGGLHRSNDGAETWESVTPAILEQYDDVVVIDDGSRHGALLVGGPSGVRLSRDGGESFQWTLELLDVHRLSVSEQTPAVWAIGKENGSTGSLVHRSLDNGASWSTLEGPAPVCSAVLAHRTDPERAWVAAPEGVYSTADGGVTWTATGDIPATARVTSLAHSSLRTNVLFAGAEGAAAGVWRSDDAGAHWTYSSDGLRSPIPDLHFDGQGRVYGVGLGTPIRSELGGRLEWEHLPYSKGATSTADAISVHPAQPERIAWLNRTQTAADYDRLLLSTNDGTSWQHITPDAAKDSFREIREVLFSPTGTLYAGSQYGDFYTSHNLGADWTQQGAPWNVLTTLLYHPSIPRLYAADASRVYVSDNDGANWAKHPIEDLHLRELQVSSQDPDELFILAGLDEYQLYRTADAGSNWSSTATGLPDHDLEHLTLNPYDPSQLLVGTKAQGVFLSVDGGSTFAPWNTGIGPHSVIAIEFDPNQPGRAWLSTGNGDLYVRDVQ